MNPNPITAGKIVRDEKLVPGLRGGGETETYCTDLDQGLGRVEEVDRPVSVPRRPNRPGPHANDWSKDQSFLPKSWFGSLREAQGGERGNALGFLPHPTHLRVFWGVGTTKND